MSITERTEIEMDAWQSELRRAGDEFESSAQEKIFDFLNNRENLCTPGFLLRRQLQRKFPAIVDEAAKSANVESFADLRDSGNVAWSPAMIEALAKILTKTNFDRCGDLQIEWRQWRNYLGDKARCQRDTAIKLLFALNMDESTANKFLLANGHELLSLRNPFEYVCKVCSDCNFTYEDAENLFAEFVARRGSVEENSAPTKPEEHFTRLVKSETERFSENDTILTDETREQILAAMLKYRHDFCKDRHDVGYSKQNLTRLQVFLKYLTLLYPTVERFGKGDILKEVPIATNENGTPKTPAHLIAAMFDTQGIDLPEYAELSDYGGPDLSERGRLKRFYDNIPFNRNVLIPLRSLAQTLRSILRAIKFPANAQAVDRDTILLLTYFFITAWKSADEERKTQVAETLTAELDEVAEDSAQTALLFALSEVVDVLDAEDEIEEPPVKVFVRLLNRMLIAFDFSEFYAPFVLDRFILICLLSSDKFDDEYLITLVIYESYRLSKNVMERNGVD